MRNILTTLLILSLWATYTTAQNTLAEPIPCGHAHNDYAKARPALTEALSKGFVSVEIDIYPYRGQLKVSHFPLLLGAKPDLEKLYFKPLQEWIDRHGQVFLDKEQPLIFMIDIKRNAELSYTMLRQLCEKYEHLLTVHYPQQDSIKKGYVEVLLSGNKPYTQVEQDSVCYMRIDGSLGKLDDSRFTASTVPRISASYGSLFSWRGKGKMPKKQHDLLLSLVEKAHNQGRCLRFWAMPNKIAIWQTFLDAGVDWMNVDDLEKFRQFWEDYDKDK